MSNLSQNPYYVFGISQHVTDAEIRSSYKKLSLKYHPDKAKPEDVAAATERMKQINAAYHKLKPENRKATDEKIKKQYWREDPERARREQREQKARDQRRWDDYMKWSANRHKQTHGGNQWDGQDHHQKAQKDKQEREQHDQQERIRQRWEQRQKERRDERQQADDQNKENIERQAEDYWRGVYEARKRNEEAREQAWAQCRGLDGRHQAIVNSLKQRIAQYRTLLPLTRLCIYGTDPLARYTARSLLDDQHDPQYEHPLRSAWTKRINQVSHQVTNIRSCAMFNMETATLIEELKTKIEELEREVAALHTTVEALLAEDRGIREYHQGCNGGCDYFRNQADNIALAKEMHASVCHALNYPTGEVPEWFLVDLSMFWYQRFKRATDHRACNWAGFS
ncbi:hypothetical protein W97_05055 [Coniosporium apollinis CBS 100218]|uniref:J domain-containing protein n=1 Tax=Coniosporium apollinis (strain CBS 100218) TaxID=1168221 RepID=R7YVW9_CONA1|nr:uncharacterized protein W97_05055 [Coniosporium apollinis CBS 100218]EON65816.1 hypothetical protein W97_05055 [Coniosporium apollinis CBS 100218]